MVVDLTSSCSASSNARVRAQYSAHSVLRSTDCFRRDRAVGNSEKSNVPHLPCTAPAASNTGFHGSPCARNQTCRAINTNQMDIGSFVLRNQRVDACRYLLFWSTHEGGGCRSHHDFTAHRGPSPSQPSDPCEQSQERDGLAIQWQAPSASWAHWSK